MEQLAEALSMAFSQFASSNVRVWSLVFQALRSPRGERESSTSVGVWWKPSGSVKQREMLSFPEICAELGVSL
ncbi:hypothetical protein EIP86_006099 [Pleurotus ostreatoroseus]|nr:hypothetical protein EIP86_006099 [Pleurotus ostreatoroseus]